jgi:arabinogalactan oligomer/maltooligosaccharide transport system permease protein
VSNPASGPFPYSLSEKVAYYFAKPKEIFGFFPVKIRCSRSILDRSAAAAALIITGLFSFMTAWAEYLVAAQILQDTQLWTLPLGLKSFESNMSTEWGLYGAASLIVMIPVVILFLLLSRWLVSGLTLGSVKG